MRRSDLALVAAVALAFSPALLAMAQVWSQHEYTSHGFLVPVIAAWMFAAKRRALGPPRRDARGLAVIGAAALLLVFGLGVGSPSWMGLAFVAAMLGLALRSYGPAGLRQLAFPLGFLLFMVPLPPAVLNPIIVRLQLWVSAAAVETLHVLGYSVLREGNVVLLPGDQRLFVDEACSGITSVVTLLPLGALLAYFGERGWLRRSVLIFAAVPIAMFGNWLRVLTTVAATERFGVEPVTQGALHDSAGLITFVLACLLLIGFGALLRAGSSPRDALAPSRVPSR
jgi:exosortase